MWTKNKEIKNEVILNLIELIKNDLVSVSVNSASYNGPTESISICNYSNAGPLNIIKNDIAQRSGAKTFSLYLTYRHAPMWNSRWEMRDSLSNKTQRITEQEYLAVKNAAEKRDDNILINEMKKMLEANQYKILEKGKELVNGDK